MRLPRDLDAPELIQALQRIGYRSLRPTGSHVRLRHEGEPVHSITLPMHSPLKLGTLSAILGDIATVHGLDRTERLRRLFPD